MPFISIHSFLTNNALFYDEPVKLAVHLLSCWDADRWDQTKQGGRSRRDLQRIYTEKKHATTECIM